MINFLFIIALLYVLFYDLKLTRYAPDSTKKVIRNMGYGFLLLIASLYTRADPLYPRSSEYIKLMHKLGQLFTLVAVSCLFWLVLKYRKELFQTILQLMRNKWNIFELTVLTVLPIATAVDTSLWSFMVTFVLLGVLIAKEVFFVALKKNNEAKA